MQPLTTGLAALSLTLLSAAAAAPADVVAPPSPRPAIVVPATPDRPLLVTSATGEASSPLNAVFVLGRVMSLPTPNPPAAGDPGALPHIVEGLVPGSVARIWSVVVPSRSAGEQYDFFTAVELRRVSHDPRRAIDDAFAQLIHGPPSIDPERVVYRTADCGALERRAAAAASAAARTNAEAVAASLGTRLVAQLADADDPAWPLGELFRNGACGDEWPDMRRDRGWFPATAAPLGAASRQRVAAYALSPIAFHMLRAPPGALTGLDAAARGPGDGVQPVVARVGGTPLALSVTGEGEVDRMPDALVVTATGPASYFPAPVAKTQFDPVVTDLERAGIPARRIAVHFDMQGPLRLTVILDPVTSKSIVRVRAVLDRRIAARELHDLKTEPVVHDCGPSRDAARRAALADAMRRAALLGGAAHASPRSVVAVRTSDQSYGVFCGPDEAAPPYALSVDDVLSTAPLAAPAQPASFTSSAELTVAAAVAPVPFGRPTKDAGPARVDPQGAALPIEGASQASDVVASGTGSAQGPIDGAAIAFSMGSDNAHGFRPIGVAQLDRLVRALRDLGATAVTSDLRPSNDFPGGSNAEVDARFRAPLAPDAFERLHDLVTQTDDFSYGTASFVYTRRDCSSLEREAVATALSDATANAAGAARARHLRLTGIVAIDMPPASAGGICGTSPVGRAVGSKDDGFLRVPIPATMRVQTTVAVRFATAPQAR